MGLLSALRPGIRPADLAAAASVPPVLPLGVGGSTGPGAPPLQLGSQWADPSQLLGVIWNDVLGTQYPRPVTRAEAMAVPAYARVRHIICGTMGRITIRAYRGDQVLTGPAAPPWVERTDGALPPFHMKLWTADDLLWYGWSCHSRVNSVADGFPLTMSRIPMGQWSVDDAGRVQLDRGDGIHELVDQRTVCLIPGPHDGLLSFAAGAIRHASDLQRAADRAAKHPSAHLVLQQVDGNPLPQSSDDPDVMTIPKLIDMWVRAREGLNGGVGYLPKNIKAQEMGSFDQHLLVEGRNAAAVDAARNGSLPSDLIDAYSQGSLTYTNSRDNDRRALDYGVGAYMAAYTARLCQNDVTPNGQRVAFDVEEWLGATVPGQPVQPAAADPTAPPVVVPIRPAVPARPQGATA